MSPLEGHGVLDAFLHNVLCLRVGLAQAKLGNSTLRQLLLPSLVDGINHGVRHSACRFEDCPPAEQSSQQEIVKNSATREQRGQLRMQGLHPVKEVGIVVAD